MSIGRYFTQVGEIQRMTLQDDGGGYKEHVWLTIMTSRGRLRPLSGDERGIGQRDTPVSTHRWYCYPFELAIDPEQQVTFFGSPFQPSQYGEVSPADVTSEDRLVVDGKAYNIVFVADPMSMGRFLQIDLKLVESEQA